jgi:predicted nucleic acid-binding protein
VKAIIADTTCLIIFSKINRLDILQKTFENIVVTDEVAEEFGDLPNWISVNKYKDKQGFLTFSSFLGKGEASSITLALEKKDSVLIMDEKKGRKVAKQLEIKLIGSLGVLLKAKQKGIINTVGEILNLFEKTDFRISESLKKSLLKIAKEDV